ncbi:hypothetical protein P9875_19030 [Janthinobacterium rivuli]|uniref:Uncharacterized protein n=1 Tax=Janthinobacterium rivuli TaxID=2751478 RepID=A0ABY8I1F9_9BURK|nr:hypothetical protein [Janthinobacterium rivuli]WFR77812.1 hypothetical protein P9875_19030 [Janthinobacterium rivuli]
MILAIRLARLLAVILVIVVARYYLLNFLEPYNFHFDFKPSLKWMNENPNLSGWAQFFGATAAILLAIAIPAWQRHGQNLDRWRDAQDVNASLALLSFYLLSEVQTHLEGYLQTGDMPRKNARRDIETADLLQRIHALEIRENNQDRITRLFRARGAIHQTASSLTLPFSQNDSLSDGEKQLIRERVSTMEKIIKEAEEENGKAIHARARANLWLLPRAIHPVILFIITGKIR